MDSIKHIGYLHYGNYEVAPLEALKQSLQNYENKDHLTDALLVLPEAFNAGSNDQYYNDPIVCGPSVMEEIRSIAQGITLVAGLTISPDETLPYSSTMLIAPDGKDDRVLCRKMGADGANGKTYQVSVDGFDGNNAIRYRNLALGALICMDAFPNEKTLRRHNLLRLRLGEIESVDHTILCVPARCKDYVALIKAPGAFLIFANGWKRHSSFIDGPAGDELIRVINPKQESNLIMMLPIGSQAASSDRPHRS